MTRARRVSQVVAGTFTAALMVGLFSSQFQVSVSAASGPRTQTADQVLAAHGVKPSSAAHQTGLRNYAGPNCPGAGWNCTTAKAVVQNAPINGVNIFDCTPSSGGTSDQANDNCVVVQSAQNNNGTNSATCHEEAVNAAPSPQCTITQDNTGGANKATVKQVLTQTSGDTQTGTELATITQTNTTGANTASIKQILVQKIDDASANQDQEAQQFACISQDSSAGQNTGAITQSQNQSEKSSSVGVTQTQNSNPGGSGTCSALNTGTANQVDAIEQDLAAGNDGGGNPIDTGKNQSTSSQTLKQKQLSMPSTGLATQSQGNNSFEGGLDGNMDQDSQGVSSINAAQLETQFQDAESSDRNQTQNGPARCCSLQRNNPSDTFKINQQSSQDSDSGAVQNNEVDGTCDTSGTCTVNQTTTEDGTPFTQSCSGTVCSVTTFCSGSSCGSGGGSGSAFLNNAARRR